MITQTYRTNVVIEALPHVIPRRVDEDVEFQVQPVARPQRVEKAL
ncbi:hypothetical protein [Bradyrhizobium manausense]|nr:hypothetical protein [Bradyrhizobium manausense]